MKVSGTDKKNIKKDHLPASFSERCSLLYYPLSTAEAVL